MVASGNSCLAHCHISNNAISCGSHFLYLLTESPLSVQSLLQKKASTRSYYATVKLGDKEHFDKEQIGVKELLALSHNFNVTKKFLITKFDCIICL